ncbi:hypothetical protein MNBD_GAMMA26-1591 [hydrothermal vent metagenome]|uniref:O-antigen ligase-related domain-containing protein n=1 Tax=hydrothermal vent metagenome TaxID=652676 RepID=A0A3B1AP31_9ZZZZ
MNTGKLDSTLTTLLSYGLCLFVVSYYVYPLDSSPKATFYAFVAFPVLLYGIYKLAELKIQAAFRLDTYSYLTMGLVLIILYIWLSYLWGTPGDYQPFVRQGKRAAEMFALLFAIGVTAHKRAFLIRPLFTAMFVIAVTHACILMPEGISKYGNSLDFRLMNPIDTGMVYGVALVIGMWRFLSEEPKVSLLYLAACLPLVVILFITKSRGPQLALVITALPIIFMHRKNWRRIIPVALAAIVLAVVLAIWTDVFQRIFSRGFDLSYRDQLWAVSIAQFLEYPIFGSGARLDMPIPIGDGFIHTHSHNLLLDVLRATGLVGFFLVATHNLIAFGRGAVSRDGDVNLWAMVFLFGFLCLMTNGGIPFTRPAHSWIAYWIPLGFVCFLLSSRHSHMCSAPNRLT